MDNLIDIYRGELASVLTGIGLIILGILIPRLKLYWLIAGLNSIPKKDLEDYNLRYIEKYFGIFIVVMGLLILLNPIVITLFNVHQFGKAVFYITIIAVIASMYLFGAINRKKIRKKSRD